MTTELCVVGSPIQHSLSPVIHSAAYSFLGLDFSYDKQELVKGGLSKVLSDGPFSGVSVTMPLKYEAFDCASGVDELAGQTGVVNTLVKQPLGWFGYNTDVSGFVKCFRQLDGIEAITMLGSGATARSAGLAISQAFPTSKVMVVGRNSGSVDGVVSLLSGFGLETSSAGSSWDALSNSDLVISTVPGGAFAELWGQVGSAKDAPRGVLFDVAYDPWPSTAAASWGPNSISGLELLIWQAVEQVKIFSQSFGGSVAVGDDELYKVMKAAIHEQSGLR